MFGLKFFESILSKYHNVLLLFALMMLAVYGGLSLHSEKQNYEQTAELSSDLKLLTAEMTAMNNRIDKSLYDQPAKEVDLALVNASNKVEVIETVEGWRRDGWTSQIASLWALCQQDGKLRLHEIVTNETAIHICRIVR